MASPQFPLLVVGDQDALEFIDSDFTNPGRAQLLSVLLPPASTLYYDSAGVKWSVRVTPMKAYTGVWSRFLARVVNPWVPIASEWIRISEYNIEELKSGINHQVDKDDDILTQFEEAEVIKAGISASKSFQEIRDVLNKYVYQVDEESLWKEREGREAGEGRG